MGVGQKYRERKKKGPDGAGESELDFETGEIKKAPNVDEVLEKVRKSLDKSRELIREDCDEC